MADEEQPEQPEALELSIDWHIPESVITRYANNMLVQQGETEFYISFFEVKPPFLIGEITKEDVMKIGSVPAECVARIAINPERMASVISALQTNFERYQAKRRAKEKE